MRYLRKYLYTVRKHRASISEKRRRDTHANSKEYPPWSEHAPAPEGGSGCTGLHISTPGFTHDQLYPQFRLFPHELLYLDDRCTYRRSSRRQHHDTQPKILVRRWNRRASDRARHAPGYLLLHGLSPSSFEH